MAAFVASSRMVETAQRIRACRDPDDGAILEVAVNGNAGAIITGDPHLLVMNPLRNPGAHARGFRATARLTNASRRSNRFERRWTASARSRLTRVSPSSHSSLGASVHSAARSRKLGQQEDSDAQGGPRGRGHRSAPWRGGPDRRPPEWRIGSERRLLAGTRAGGRQSAYGSSQHFAPPVRKSRTEPDSLRRRSRANARSQGINSQPAPVQIAIGSPVQAPSFERN